MRNKNFGSILLSIMILVSMTSVLVTISMTVPIGNAYMTNGYVDNVVPLVGSGYFYSSASLLVENGYADSIVATFGENGYSVDTTAPPPTYWYNADNTTGAYNHGGRHAPAVAATQIGSGKVLVVGSAGGSVAYTRNTDMNTENMFQNWINWLDNTNKRTMVWYQGHHMYYSACLGTDLCYNFAENLENLGWKIYFDNNDPITSADFGADNAVFWLNTLEVGYPWVSSEITAITNYVTNGGNLLIGAQSDYGGYEMTDQMNLVLDNLQCHIRFNDDEMGDNVNNYNTTFFDPRVYLTTHPANNIPSYLPSLQVDPPYRDGLKGGIVTYTITVTNSGYNNDNENITITDDNGWTTSLSAVNPLPVAAGKDNYTTLSVTIPTGQPYLYDDNIRIKVTSKGDPTKFDNLIVNAFSATWIQPPENDTQTTENVPTRIYGGSTNMYVGSSNNQYLDEWSYLQFNLKQGIPSGYTISNAWLYIWCFRVAGGYGENVQLCQYPDNWSETTLTWSNQSNPGTVISTRSITDQNQWYGFDVTSYVQAQYPLDNIISFCIIPQTSHLASPDNFSYGFDQKEYAYPDDHPYMVFGIRPAASRFIENFGGPGDNVHIQAVINNRGAVIDNENVTITTQGGWTVSPTNVRYDNIKPGENRITLVTVTIPGGAIDMMPENLIENVFSIPDSTLFSTSKENRLWIGFEDNLLPGWNMVGFPAINENSPDNILPTYQSGSTFQRLYHIWKWSVVPPGYVPPVPTAPVSENIGYWVQVENTFMVRIGKAVASDTIRLVGNYWNMVEFPAENDTTTPAKMFAGHTYHMWRWNVSPAGYVPVSSSLPVARGVAYWVLIDDNENVQVPM